MACLGLPNMHEQWIRADLARELEAVAWADAGETAQFGLRAGREAEALRLLLIAFRARLKELAQPGVRLVEISKGAGQE